MNIERKKNATKVNRNTPYRLECFFLTTQKKKKKLSIIIVVDENVY